MLMISEQVLARWRRLVAFRKALDLLHQAIYAKVPAHCVGVFFIVGLLIVALAANKAIHSE